jgi:glycosyl transferase family 1/glycosyl transferase family 4
LRVLFVQGAGERAGAEVALLARMRHLPEHGIEPVVAMLADGPFLEEVRGAGFPVVRLGAAPPRVRDIRRIPGTVRALAAAARTVDAAVLEGAGEKMSFFAGWAARLAGCGCVFNLQDPPRRNGASTLVQLVAATGRRDAVVVPSRWMADEFRRAWGFSPEVVPNALVTERLPTRARDVRAAAGWPEEAVVAGLFGRLVRWKGHEVFLRAAARVPEVRFMVVGGTLYGWERDYPGRLRALAGELALGRRVSFTGHREDALELMAGCDIVCHCSTAPEPFGMVVIEAMALGRAVVATRTGGPEEIVADGRTGVLVDPEDEGALAGAVAGLAGDPALRARLGAQARAAARRDYDARRVADALAGIYRRAGERRRGGPA